jgi:hypothetical protein
MRKKNFDRTVKKIHEINNMYGISTPIRIKKLLPLNQQTNYNSVLREWYGPKQWTTIVETNGEFDAFKESEDWKEIGTLSVHDYKCKINDNLGLVLDDISNYTVERLDNNQNYDVIFYREFIGEVHLGLRPVINNEP